MDNETDEEWRIHAAGIESTTDSHITQQSRKETTMVQFFTLGGLKSAVAATRVDLTKVRTVNATLSQKVAALNKRDQFAAPYITQQTALLREAASQQVQNYLTQQQTFPRLKSIQAQKPHWTPRAYLLRGLTVEVPLLQKYDEAANTTALLKAVLIGQRATNALLSVSQLPLTAVAETFDAALLGGDLALAAVSYAALVKAGEGGDDTARRAANSIEAERFPAVTEATDLIDEAAHIEELLGYTLRSISSGDSDLGIRMESYQQQANSREQARNQAHAQEELDRQGYEVRRQMGDLKPAA